MRFTVLTAAASIVGLVAAQFPGLPTCATNCLTSGLPTECGLDQGCICRNEAFITNISCCISQNCPESDQQAALQAANTICTGTGANLPSAASCAPGASGASSTTAASSASGTAATGSSTTMSGTMSMTSDIVTSAVVGSDFSSLTSAGATATATGQANKLGAQGMGIAGAILGAVALL